MPEIINPFTPSSIASQPDMFFGRVDELRDVTRALGQGSVAIQGAIGIGKSSLLSKALLHLSGFESDYNSTYVTVVANADIETVDDAARLILEEMAEIDEKRNTIKISLPKIVSYESQEVYRQFEQNRHLAALTRLIRDPSFQVEINKTDSFIIAVDEADKCPEAMARLMRAIETKVQLDGITNLRFLFAGVSPFFEEMIREDPGISRFIYRNLSLSVMNNDDVEDLLDYKFEQLAKQAEVDGISLTIDPNIIERIKQLSGGHPHLLQLLGSLIIEHEYADPDGEIDKRDMVNSLQTICYESRGPVYENIIHYLQLEDKFAVFERLLGPVYENIIHYLQLEDKFWNVCQ